MVEQKELSLASKLEGPLQTSVPADLKPCTSCLPIQVSPSTTALPNAFFLFALGEEMFLILVHHFNLAPCSAGGCFSACSSVEAGHVAVPRPEPSVAQQPCASSLSWWGCSPLIPPCPSPGKEESPSLLPLSPSAKRERRKDAPGEGLLSCSA